MNYDSTKIIYQYTDDNSKELIGRISLKIKNETKNVNGNQDQTAITDIFKNISKDIMNNIVIKGIKNIKNIIINENKEDKRINTKVDHEIQKKENYFLETDGTNLVKILNNRYVDPTCTLSNDIIEMYKIFGIESVRERLIVEIIDVVKHEGEYINTRHIELLCDVMTHKGTLFSINRQGINSGDVGPLAKSSFEDTTDQLIKAAIFSEKDNLQGVSGNIMLGQVIKSGTGVCDILLDEEKLISELEDSGEKEEDYMDVDESNIDILMNIEEEDVNCNDENLKFSHE
jgi:DNA-directed RNA polymerase II subunit RPB1